MNESENINVVGKSNEELTLPAEIQSDSKCTSQWDNYFCNPDEKQKNKG